MPYSPAIYNNPGIAPGINALANVFQQRGGIWGMVDDWNRKKQQQEQADATSHVLFHSLAAQKDEAGNPLVSSDERAAFQSGTPQQRAGILAGLLNRSEWSSQAADRDLKWKIANLRDTPDPNAGKPQPMTLPDGSVVPGHYWIPGANRVLDLSPNNGGPPAGLFIPPGWVWNGRELVQQHSQSQDDLEQLDALNRRTKLASIDQQLADAQGEIAAGNVRAGPDWLPVTTPFADQVKKLQTQRAAILQQPGSPAQPTPGPRGKVHVRHPDGTIGFIPAEQLQSALVKGYQQVP